MLLTRVKKSDIHGVGLFASMTILKGSKICVIFVKENKTNLWQPTRKSMYINHSKNANTEYILEKNELYLIAATNIKFEEEITANYNKLKSLGIDLTHLNINYDLD